MWVDVSGRKRLGDYSHCQAFIGAVISDYSDDLYGVVSLNLKREEKRHWLVCYLLQVSSYH